MNAESIIFYILAFAILAFSVLTVTTKRIIRSAMFLFFTLLGTAGLYFLLGYTFLGSVQMMVYAGGIVVLFVFSILLTSHPGDNTPALVSQKRVLGLIAAVAMFLVTGYSLISRCSFLSATASGDNPLMEEIGTALMGTGHGQYLLPFEAISVLLLACIIGGVVIARKN